MKRTLFTILLASFMLATYAQKIDNNVVLQDGSNVDTTHVFLDGESVTYHLTDNKSDNIEWRLRLPNKMHERQQVLVSNAESFTFEVSKDLFSPLDYNYEQTTFEGDSSVYIIGSICLYKDAVPVDSVPIVFNVLPSRPTLINASLVGGEFNSDWLGYDPLTTLKITFSSTRMTSCGLLNYVVLEAHDYFTFPTDYGYLTIPNLAYTSIADDTFETEYANSVDWAEFYSLYATNKYGSVYSTDTIYTTDLITDPNVLSVINALRTTSDINENDVDDVQLLYSNNVLSIEGYGESDIELEIFSLNGQCVYSAHSQKRVDLTFLPQGVYVANVRLAHKQPIQRKIIIH